MVHGELLCEGCGQKRTEEREETESTMWVGPGGSSGELLKKL